MRGLFAGAGFSEEVPPLCFRIFGEKAGHPGYLRGNLAWVYRSCSSVTTPAIYRDVTRKGLDASRPFVGNGMWVTSLRDPDGYSVEFESYTEVPEETVFEDDATDIRSVAS